MKTDHFFDEFFTIIENDSRIGPAHVSLYMALIQWYHRHGVEQPISFFARDIMPLAKYSSVTTFYKSIRALHEYGYIKYLPSFNPAIGCKVYFNFRKYSANVTKEN